MRKNLNILQNVVEKVIQKYPDSANDISILFAKTYEELGYVTPDSRFLDVLMNAHSNNYYQFESISRVTRKIKHIHPEWFDKKVEKKKQEKQQEYIDYHRGTE